MVKVIQKQCESDALTIATVYEASCGANRKMERSKEDNVSLNLELNRAYRDLSHSRTLLVKQELESVELKRKIALSILFN